MTILERFSVIMKSNALAVLDKAEDPSGIINQILMDMRKDLAAVKNETSDVLSTAKQSQKRVEECSSQIARYETAIERAVTQGEEDDARKMISKKQEYEKQLPLLKSNAKIAAENVEKICQMHDKLATEIEQLEARKMSMIFHGNSVPASFGKSFSAQSGKSENADAIEEELKRVRAKLSETASE